MSKGAHTPKAAKLPSFMGTIEHIQVTRRFPELPLLFWGWMPVLTLRIGRSSGSHFYHRFSLS
jgi:hypothetical protein